MSGDVTYTEQLVDAPPPGVEYLTYDRAIEEGLLVEVGSRQAVRRSTLRERPQQLLVAAARKVESWIRRSGLAYREPVRVFTVAPGRFDAIHVHVFRTSFLGPHPPIIVSAGGGLRDLYRRAWHWGRLRIWGAETFDRVIGACWDATLFGTRRGKAAHFVTLGDEFRQELVRRGWPESRVTLARNYLDLPSADRRTVHHPVTLGFVAKDFATKGGHIALQGFQTLRERHPDLHLLVAGSPPPESAKSLMAKGISWVGLIARDGLLTEFMPKIDILLYPTLWDTGVPYTPMEALAAGIPCVVSNVASLPELVRSGAGRICPVSDPDCIVRVVEDLLDAQAWVAASDAARRRFDEYFSAASQAPVLGEVYRQVLAERVG